MTKMREMNIKKKFGILLLIFLLFVTFNSVYFSFMLKGVAFQIEDKNDLGNSGSWDLTGSNILIDDLDPTKNWSYTATQFEWCSGSGSWMDPYIIENVTIDGQDTGNCILIKNSNEPFIIRNCNLTNGIDGSTGGGIKLVNTSNGFLIGNNCSDNINGIVLQSDSDNNTILDNICHENYWHGIFIEQNCDYNNFSWNVAKYNKNGFFMRQACIGNSLFNNSFSHNLYYSNILYNTGHGIYGADRCNDTTIMRNAILNNTFEGIQLSTYCYHSEISKNVIKFNGYAIILEGYSEYSLIKGNLIANNRLGGVELSNCPRVDIIYNGIYNNGGHGLMLIMPVLGYNYGSSTIKNNLIIDNNNLGIYLRASYNYIYNNSFIGNGQNAREYDSETSNSWNFGGLGNFWDDYLGEDIDGNGIGDSPYDVPEFPSGTSKWDNYPIYRFTYLFINDASSNDWAWAKTNGYCTGSGSYSDPYIIKDIKISNTSLGYLNRIHFKDGIFIRNSNAYFKIENCSITNLERTSISLYHTRNGYIDQNNFSLNGINGIYMYNCDNTTIESNLISSNGNNGIELHYGNNDDIIDNFIQFNTKEDIRCENSGRLTFKNNTIQNSGSLEAGIWLYDCDRFLIESNIITGQWIGINIIYESDFNELINNYIDPGYYGILLQNEASDNLIYQNKVVGATVYCRDDGNNNEWDNGSIGNYWGNYGGVDANDDGIGDSPYSISGFAGSQDRYPIWDDGEHGNPPVITILSPTLNAVYSTNSPDFTVSIEEMYIDTSWYQLVGGSTNYTFTGISGKINQALWDEFGNEMITFRVFVNDTSGNLSYDEIEIFKDTLEPYVYIISPQPYELYGKNPASFIVFISDTNLDIMWYSFNGGLTNHSFVTNGTFNSVEWNNLQNGSVTIEFYAIDKAGNIGIDMVTIRIDIINPEIILFSPVNNDVFGMTAPEFFISLNDINLDTSWYILNGKTYIFTENETLNQSAWDSYANGTLLITFYANDSVGNVGLQEVLLQKDIIGPIINIINPVENNFYPSNPPQFNLSIIDGNLNSIWYSLDSGTVNITCYNFIGFINQSEWDKRNGGLIIFRVYANDMLGNFNFTEIVIYKDITAPNISIDLPTFNQLCGLQAPSFEIHITELNLQEVSYSLNGGQNITITTQNQLDQTEWAKIGNGTVVINFYAIDKAGNLNSRNVFVRKDVYEPEIVIHSPIPYKTFGATPPDFSISIVEVNLLTSWYTIEGVTGNFYLTELNGTIDQNTWNRIPQGEILLTFYAEDIVGNIGTASVEIRKHIPSDQSIPGYNLLVIIGVIFVVSIILRKTKETKQNFV